LSKFETAREAFLLRFRELDKAIAEMDCREDLSVLQGKLEDQGKISSLKFKNQENVNVLNCLLQQPQEPNPAIAREPAE